jgi:hypothetical protein
VFIYLKENVGTGFVAVLRTGIAVESPYASVRAELLNGFTQENSMGGE